MNLVIQMKSKINSCANNEKRELERIVQTLAPLSPLHSKLNTKLSVSESCRNGGTLPLHWLPGNLTVTKRLESHCNLVLQHIIPLKTVFCISVWIKQRCNMLVNEL